MRNLFHPLLPLAAIFLWTLGCHSEVAPTLEEAALAEPSAPTINVASAEPTPAGPTPAVADPKESQKVASSFTPPFPDRLELFEPPKRAQSTVRRDDEHGESVELKGFINVDQPRVILSIDGVVSP